MMSEGTPDPAAVREFMGVLYPLIATIRAERTLSPGKIGILHHLSVNGRATTAELAAAVQVSPQAISLSTRELEELQLISRIRDDEDRRRTWIVPTEAGAQTLAREVNAGEERITQAITERLSHEEREILVLAIPVLRKIGAAENRG